MKKSVFDTCTRRRCRDMKSGSRRCGIWWTHFLKDRLKKLLLCFSDRTARRFRRRSWIGLQNSWTKRESQAKNDVAVRQLVARSDDYRDCSGRDIPAAAGFSCDTPLIAGCCHVMRSTVAG